MSNKKRTPILPAILLFAGLNLVFLALKKFLQAQGFDTDILIIGNAVLFLVTILTFRMSARGLQTSNNHAFFRLVYGSFMIKLFVIAGVALVYIMAFKKELNKPALFTCMGLYLVYTFLEVSALMKLSKQQKNA